MDDSEAIIYAQGMGDTDDNADGITRDEMMKIWKGLFFCMYNADKLLVQEELADDVSGLIKFISTNELKVLFLEMALETYSREWNCIDHFRLDKYFMMFTRVFRQFLIHISKRSWKISEVKNAGHLLEKFLICPMRAEQPKCHGLQVHLVDIYLEELAKVGGPSLPSDVILAFIFPYIKVLACVKDPRYVQTVKRRIFDYLIEQSDVGEEPNSDPEVENQPPRNGPMDPRAGGVDVVIPTLKPDFNKLADAMMSVGSLPAVTRKTRGVFYDYVKKFRSLARGEFPLEGPDFSGIRLSIKKFKNNQMAKENEETEEVSIEESASEKINVERMALLRAKRKKKNNKKKPASPKQSEQSEQTSLLNDLSNQLTTISDQFLNTEDSSSPHKNVKKSKKITNATNPDSVISHTGAEGTKKESRSKLETRGKRKLNKRKFKPDGDATEIIASLLSNEVKSKAASKRRLTPHGDTWSIIRGKNTTVATQKKRRRRNRRGMKKVKLVPNETLSEVKNNADGCPRRTKETENDLNSNENNQNPTKRHLSADCFGDKIEGVTKKLKTGRQMSKTGPENGQNGDTLVNSSSLSAHSISKNPISNISNKEKSSKKSASKISKPKPKVISPVRKALSPSAKSSKLSPESAKAKTAKMDPKISHSGTWDDPLQEGEYEIVIPSKKFAKKVSPKEKLMAKKAKKNTKGMTLKINLGLNQEHEYEHYARAIKSSPAIPFSAHTRPDFPVLKPTPSPSPSRKNTPKRLLQKKSTVRSLQIKYKL